MLLYLAVNIFLSILFNYVLYGHRTATTAIYTITHAKLKKYFEIQCANDYSESIFQTDNL